ncbi:MAG: hypothetical protein R3B72_51855 [Polyangiaceae bacterium]
MRARDGSKRAWEHVYRLLLSVDRRTGLAHVYDANHMQPGGNFHARAKCFTDLLCAHWNITSGELKERVDYMFQFCLDEYLAQRKVTQSTPTTLEDLSLFGQEVAERIARSLQVSISADLLQLAYEIDLLGEDHFTLDRKRQNVRGEGNEDILAWLLLKISGVPRERLLVRTSAAKLPGFAPPVKAKSKDELKVPKPDLAILSADRRLTQWIITAKWSTRQDRLDQFGQEFSYYNGHRTQELEVQYVFITNEMDIARLRGALNTPPSEGGFHFHRVYHVNLDLLAKTQGERFADLELYRTQGRLLSLEDLLHQAAEHFGAQDN